MNGKKVRLIDIVSWDKYGYLYTVIVQLDIKFSLERYGTPAPGAPLPTPLYNYTHTAVVSLS